MNDHKEQLEACSCCCFTKVKKKNRSVKDNRHTSVFSECSHFFITYIMADGVLSDSFMLVSDLKDLGSRVCFKKKLFG